MQKIIIDTDCSLGQFARDVDDGLAIIMALNSPELEILGITGVYGNTHLKKVEVYLKRLLHVWEESNNTSISFQTVMGSDKPLHKLYNECTLDMNLKSSVISGDKFPAIKFMADVILKNPNEVILVPIGPLTNISLLFELFPEVIDKIKMLSIMGGKLDGYEFNFTNDPIAVNKVANSNVKAEICGLEVCQAQKITKTHIEEILSKNTPLTNYLNEPLKSWLKINSIYQLIDKRDR